MEKVPTPVVRHISAEVVPMGPPPPPKPKQSKDSTFMEKLHAVDEELASSPVCMDSYQVPYFGMPWEYFFLLNEDLLKKKGGGSLFSAIFTAFCSQFVNLNEMNMFGV